MATEKNDDDDDDDIVGRKKRWRQRDGTETDKKRERDKTEGERETQEPLAQLSNVSHCPANATTHDVRVSNT